jgi:hypothetical protein
MHVPDRTKIDIPIWKMVQPRVLVVLFGVLVAFTLFFWWTTDSEEVERRKQSASAHCFCEGNSETTCYRQVEQHPHSVYWDWAYTPMRHQQTNAKREKSRELRQNQQ